MLHETPSLELDRLKRIVEWCDGRLQLAAPADVDLVVAGRWPYQADRLLLTFDDGFSSNFAAAEWLWKVGISASFFIVPSLVDRTVGEFLRFHDRRGVQAFPPVSDLSRTGLSSSQVKELVGMGHRVGAHNFAHRDLGQLHAQEDLRFEIGDAMDAVGELTGSECRDFAIAFGQPENLSTEATAYLVARGARVYSCHRGLNIPGQSPRFLLRHDCSPGHPAVFTWACLEGGADHWHVRRSRTLMRLVGPLPMAAEAEAD